VFGIFDWVVVAAYFAAMAAIGAHFSRKNKNFGDFMFGGGNMPWLAVGISLIATSVSANTFLGNPADTFAQDMRLLMLGGGSLLAIAVTGIVFIPRFRASGVSSAYELLERRFSRPVRLLAATLYSLHLLLRTGLLIYVPALVLERILHVPLWASILLMSVAAVLYTYHGGIRAVTWTDVVQFVVFFGAGLGALWICADRLGGFGAAMSLAGEAGKTRWFSTEWNPASDRNLWSAVGAYAFFELAIRGCDQQFVQRYLSCKNVREANLSSLASGVLGIAVGIVFFLLGAFLFAYYRVAELAPLPVADVNQAFPHFILTTLPTGFKGVLVAAILAAAMSSQSSALTALSNTTVVDFLKHDGASESGLKPARRWVLIWGAAGTLAAFAASMGNVSILSKALFFTSLFIGPLLALFLLAFFRPKLGSHAVFAGAIGGMIVLLLFLEIPVLPAGMWNPPFGGIFSWPWNPLISMSATMVIAEGLNMIGKKSPGIGPFKDHNITASQQ
jgi:SSS family solute:Na+ symporter